MKKNVLIVELNDYHTENFPIYKEYLPNLFNQEKLDIQFCTQMGIAKGLRQTGANVFAVSGNKLTNYFLSKLNLTQKYSQWKLKKIIAQYKPDVIVFNTVEPAYNYKLFQEICSDGIVNIAIIHNPEVFSKTEKNNNAYFFALSEIVYENHTDLLDGYMLPYFNFHDYMPESSLKNQEKILIGVQGHIDFARRDYPFLIEIARELKRHGINKYIFNIIGRLHKEKLEALVDKYELENYFIFHGWLSDDAFFGQINRCHYILPLLGEKQRCYFRDKMTGSYTHSASFRIPMIVSEENARAWNLNSDIAVIFKDLDDIISQLQNLTSETKLAQSYSQYIDKKIAANRQFLDDLDISV